LGELLERHFGAARGARGAVRRQEGRIPIPRRSQVFLVRTAKKPRAVVEGIDHHAIVAEHGLPKAYRVLHQLYLEKMHRDLMDEAARMQDLKHSPHYDEMLKRRVHEQWKQEGVRLRDPLSHRLRPLSDFPFHGRGLFFAASRSMETGGQRQRVAKEVERRALQGVSGIYDPEVSMHEIRTHLARIGAMPRRISAQKLAWRTQLHGESSAASGRPLAFIDSNTRNGFQRMREIHHMLAFERGHGERPPDPLDRARRHLASNLFMLTPEEHREWHTEYRQLQKETLADPQKKRRPNVGELWELWRDFSTRKRQEYLSSPDYAQQRDTTLMVARERREGGGGGLRRAGKSLSRGQPATLRKSLFAPLSLTRQNNNVGRARTALWFPVLMLPIERGLEED
jgi:hypothetical protein